MSKNKELKTVLFLPGEITDREHCFDRVEPWMKHPGNPILKVDKPWEDKGVHWPTFLYSQKDELYKMWYEVVDNNLEQENNTGELIDNSEVQGRFYKCYAYSQDGINWTKPSVGLFKQDIYPGNNIVWVDSGFIGGVATVIEDLDDPDPERVYKMLIYDHNGKGKNGLRTAISKDGIKWNVIGDFPMLPSQDTPSLWHDKRRKRYVAFLKTRLNNVRARMISYSDDFVHWSEPALSLAPDGIDPATMNFYAQSAFYHSGHDLGLLNCFDTSSQLSDVELITAPQGIDWRRFPTRPKVLKPGDPGSWDCGGIYPGIGEPIEQGDACWIYYCGSKTRHDGTLIYFDQEPNVHGQIGIAMFRKGRLIGQQFEGDGWFNSKPILCPGGSLYLNALTKNPINVEIRGTGYASVINGFERDSCIPVTGDNDLHPVRWNGKDCLDDLKGQYISIRVYGNNGVVYGASFK